MAAKVAAAGASGDINSRHACIFARRRHERDWQLVLHGRGVWTSCLRCVVRPLRSERNTKFGVSHAARTHVPGVSDACAEPKKVWANSCAAQDISRFRVCVSGLARVLVRKKLGEGLVGRKVGLGG